MVNSACGQAAPQAWRARSTGQVLTPARARLRALLSSATARPQKAKCLARQPRRHATPEISAMASRCGVFQASFKNDTLQNRGAGSGGVVASCRVVATIGLHASASTWVFNVVRELMIARFGESAVSAVYAETLNELPGEPARSDQPLVIKSHHGSPELDRWLAANDAQYFVSIRDPRDASISMAQRFKAPLGAAVHWLESDCRRVMNFATAPTPLALRIPIFRTPSRPWSSWQMRLGSKLNPA